MAKLSIGGQAVIEGVMMRGPKDVAVAVRKADGTIDVDVKPVNSISDRYPILKKPLLRGVVALVESLVMGMKALSYSAQVSGDEDEQMDDKEMALTMVVSVALAVGLFIAIPTWSMRYLQQWTQSSLTLFFAWGSFWFILPPYLPWKISSGCLNTTGRSTRRSSPMRRACP